MRSIKKVAFQDNFIKHYCCSAHNHPSGWSSHKRMTRKKTRSILKKELTNEY